MKPTGFIGGGRITRIFLKAWKNREVMPEKVVVYDINDETVAKLKIEFPSIELSDNLKQVAGQDFVFIALHPPVIMETLDKIAGYISDDSIVISLAPKISVEKIAGRLPTKNIARLIPNATSYVNRGYNPLTIAPGCTTESRKSIMELLTPLGHTFEVAEPKLEAYAILSAMLPTYFWFQWNELGKLGPRMGLTEEETAMSIRESLIAGIEIMYDHGMRPEEVIDLIPVKPIGASEAQIAEIYQTILPALFEKIKP
ncbi:MAG: NAD(P)-binding domain-containing protein [Bacteroidales bacterium]|jgi:pyrroline-5-carboxylate reductase|nr:NAD(P)-binding domain-containing protein [Bacteroidales bacterium]